MSALEKAALKFWGETTWSYRVWAVYNRLVRKQENPDEVFEKYFSTLKPSHISDWDDTKTKKSMWFYFIHCEAPALDRSLAFYIWEKSNLQEPIPIYGARPKQQRANIKPTSRPLDLGGPRDVWLTFYPPPDPRFDNMEPVRCPAQS